VTNLLFALKHLLQRTLQRSVRKDGRFTCLRKQSMGGRGGTGFSWVLILTFRQIYLPSPSTQMPRVSN